MHRFSFKNLYLYGISAIALIMAIVGVMHLASHIVNLLIPYNYPSTDLQSQVSMKITDKRGIVISIVQIIVAAPIYLYHWRQARRSED